MKTDNRKYLIVVAILLFVAWRAGLLGDGLPFTTPGPRTVIVARQSDKDTAKDNIEYNKLRTGTQAAYLKEQQHTLLILDVDLTDEDGNPSPLIAQFAPFGAMPELLIVEPPSKVLAREKFVDADTTIATLKANGG